MLEDLLNNVRNWWMILLTDNRQSRTLQKSSGILESVTVKVRTTLSSWIKELGKKFWFKKGRSQVHHRKAQVEPYNLIPFKMILTSLRLQPWMDSLRRRNCSLGFNVIRLWRGEKCYDFQLCPAISLYLCLVLSKLQ